MLMRPLTDEQINQYEKDGYVIIRNGCSEDLIDAFNAHIYTIRSAKEIADWAVPGKTWTDKDRFSTRLFNPHKQDGFSLQMIKLPIIRGALCQLMGDEAVGIQSMYFFKEPGAKGQAAHQDYYYIKTEPNTMIAASIAMDKTDEENGCLWVIPGSHKLGLLTHGEVKDLVEHEHWTHETEGIDLGKQIPVIMEKGDLLIFHNLLIHSSTLNRSTNRWRRSYVCHYVHHASFVGPEHLRFKTPLIRENMRF
ncbi:phytanoyl-CoA dioxygenase family protein [Paenibacillus montanisoli]|nr:phytanoyl-CoA dioxygenase family protein [Paenibacillus montanisoli]